MKIMTYDEISNIISLYESVFHIDDNSDRDMDRYGLYSSGIEFDDPIANGHRICSFYSKNNGRVRVWDNYRRDGTSGTSLSIDHIGFYRIDCIYGSSNTNRVTAGVMIYIEGMSSGHDIYTIDNHNNIIVNEPIDWKRFADALLADMTRENHKILMDMWDSIHTKYAELINKRTYDVYQSTINMYNNELGKIKL